MATAYLPAYPTIEEACDWLQKHTGETWGLSRLIECGLKPWFWLDHSPAYPVISGDRLAGVAVEILFNDDLNRLEFDGTDAFVTWIRTLDGKDITISPGMSVPGKELRFKREGVERLANDASPETANTAKMRVLLKETESDLIIRTLKDLGYDLMCLPVGKGRTKGAKAYVWENIGKKFISRDSFDSRWKRMKNDGFIADKK